MQIPSASFGASSRAALYPSLVPAPLREPVDAVAKAADNPALATVRNARALQQVAPTLVAEDSDASRALVLARQREGSVGLAGNVESGRTGNEAAAQRAVEQYNTVAATEQRFELTEILAGIDVFA